MHVMINSLQLLRTDQGVPTRGTESAGPSPAPNLPADTAEYSQETKLSPGHLGSYPQNLGTQSRN